jgi:hypothetical protein
MRKWLAVSPAQLVNAASVVRCWSTFMCSRGLWLHALVLLNFIRAGQWITAGELSLASMHARHARCLTRIEWRRL